VNVRVHEINSQADAALAGGHRLTPAVQIFSFVTLTRLTASRGTTFHSGFRHLLSCT